MSSIFLIIGLIFQGIGFIVDIFFIKAMGKHAEKYAGELLSEYKNEDIVPETKTNLVLVKIIKRSLLLLVIPLSMHLLGTIFMIIFMIIRSSHGIL